MNRLTFSTFQCFGSILNVSTLSKLSLEANSQTKTDKSQGFFLLMSLRLKFHKYLSFEIFAENYELLLHERLHCSQCAARLATGNDIFTILFLFLLKVCLILSQPPIHSLKSYLAQLRAGMNFRKPKENHKGV